MKLYLRFKKGLKIIFICCLYLLLIPMILNSQIDLNNNSHLINLDNLYGERIFFTKHKVQHGIVLGDIYTMDPSGGNVQQLTNFSKYFYITERPEISSDGTKLAFCSNFEGWKSSNYVDAFILDFDTGIFTRITGFEKTTSIINTGTVNVKVTDPNDYALSPSAIRISYRGCTEFITGNTATLTVPADEEIWIKAEVARAKGDVELIIVPSGGIISLDLNLMNGTITVESCSPSPNGNYLAVSRYSETISQQDEAFPWYKILIWDTHNNCPLSEAGGLKLNGDKHPSYSHDGSMLAICTGELFSNSLAVLSTNNITGTPNILVEGKRFFNQEFCSDPAWSPDSKEIVFVYTIINADGNLQANLFKVPAFGGTPVQLTFFCGKEIVSRPSFSPDGTKIAFCLLESKNITFNILDWLFYNYTGNIHIISSKGGKSTSITSDGNAIDPSWGIVNTAVKVSEKTNSKPISFSLFQNYPNPFNPITTIKYSLKKTSKVQLNVFDVLGNKVADLVNQYQTRGEYEIDFNGYGFSSGIYYSRLTADGFMEIKKMILLK